jgi:hypothetical protein
MGHFMTDKTENIGRGGRTAFYQVFMGTAPCGCGVWWYAHIADYAIDSTCETHSKEKEDNDETEIKN